MTETILMAIFYAVIFYAFMGFWGMIFKNTIDHIPTIIASLLIGVFAVYMETFELNSLLHMAIAVPSMVGILTIVRTIYSSFEKPYEGASIEQMAQVHQLFSKALKEVYGDDLKNLASELQQASTPEEEKRIRIKYATKNGYKLPEGFEEYYMKPTTIVPD